MRHRRAGSPPVAIWRAFMDGYALIICGDRHGQSDWEPTIVQAIEPLRPHLNPTVVIHGDATGVDTVAANIIRSTFSDVTILPFPALWGLFEAAGMRKLAGPHRNSHMLTTLLGFKAAGWECAVLGFHPFIHNSKGTANMLNQAKRADVYARVYKKDGSWERW